HLADRAADELGRECVAALVERDAEQVRRGHHREAREHEPLVAGLRVRGAPDAPHREQRGDDQSGDATHSSSTGWNPSRAARRSDARLSSSAPHTGRRGASAWMSADATIVPSPSWRAPGITSTLMPNNVGERHGAYA